jgi:hypothetical protein
MMLTARSASPLLIGLFGAELLTIKSLSLAQFLNSVLKQGPLLHLISPRPAEQKEHFFHVSHD